MAEIHGAAIWPFEKILEDLSSLLCTTQEAGTTAGEWTNVLQLAGNVISIYVLAVG